VETKGSSHGAIDDAVRDAVEAATRAPSVHNTQPWRFRITGGTIDLYADRERTLRTLDPEGRQLTLSCGAALGFLRTALRGAGLDSAVEPLPEGTGSDFLARVTVTSGSEPSEQEGALAAVIATRHTQRTPFESRNLPSAVLRQLRQVVEAEGAWLTTLTRREDQIQLVSLLARADTMERQNDEYLAELRAWVRTDASTDGISVDVLPGAGERHSEVVIRDFEAGGSEAGPSEAGGSDAAASTTAAPSQPVDEHPAVVVLGTDGDSPADHLVAGQALGRLLLAAASIGVGASPLGQVLDWPGPRAMLRQQLGIVGAPQMVLRMGYGRDESTAGTARRPLNEVLLP
jgi:nitroreductase